LQITSGAGQVQNSRSVQQADNKFGPERRGQQGVMMSGHTCKAGIDIRHARVNLEL